MGSSINALIPAAIPGSTLAAARLAGNESLAVFRALLAAAARPGKPVALDADLIETLPAALLAPLALVDLDHVIAVLGDDVAEAGWASLIAAATDARLTDVLGEADVVIARRSPTAEEIGALRTGSALLPEAGARLFIACHAVTTLGPTTEQSKSGSIRFRVSGPGASTPRVVEIAGVCSDLPAAIAAANSAFPAGIDVWFIDDAGTVVAIPRSSLIIPDASSEGGH
ncbi:phosphonate C-P lyase system protein PhnH [Ilumatobacter sp.]|uniref:phosphonate C-P lyase system protein PhnH n=1 Tax=Ilumatobacter sp. TaxID=1967498 RepID=UPI0037535653